MSVSRRGAGTEGADGSLSFCGCNQPPHFSVPSHVTLTGFNVLAPKQPGVLFKLACSPRRNPEHLLYMPHTALGQLSNNMDPGRGCCPRWWRQPSMPVAHSKRQRALRTGVQAVGCNTPGKHPRTRSASRGCERATVGTPRRSWASRGSPVPESGCGSSPQAAQARFKEKDEPHDVSSKDTPPASVLPRLAVPPTSLPGKSPRAW